MSGSDGYVQVAADSVGKKVDAAALVRSTPDDTGTPITVERQRVSIASDDDPQSVVGVQGGALNVNVNLDDVVVQLKRVAMLLQLLVGQEVSEKDVT